MRKTNEQIHRLAALLSLTVLAVAEALAQESQTMPARRIVISIPDRKLALIESGRVLRVFPTAVGSPRTPSPAGSYKIVQRIANPTWYTKGKVVPPGKANPLGTRWIGLSAKGYGIHGTNNPSSIGASVSHGCIRMRNRDVEELFPLVSVGDSVDLYSERTPELESIFGSEMVATAR
ncbi:MAG TPA: L,D-transpeptidase [Bryobacteraceae bacterium]